MTRDVLVRAAGPEDAEGFVTAHEAAWDAAMGEIVGRRLEELAPFAQRVDHARASLEQTSEAAGAWVAERSGEIVGIAVAVRATPKSVELRDLYVLPSAWGTGVAPPLLDAALDGVRGDATDAYLWVVEANARARRFYEREGWSTEGESRQSPLGPTELRYRLALD